jgi:hypothetical protein
VLTDSNGNRAFTDLAQGKYVIRIVQQAGSTDVWIKGQIKAVLSS